MIIAAFLSLCLAPPVPMPELVGQMVHDGYHYVESAEPVVLVRDDAGHERWMMVLSEETACEIRS